MSDTVSQRIYDAARSLLERVNDTPNDLSKLLNATLMQFINESVTVTSGVIVDPNGKISAPFETVIHNVCPSSISCEQNSALPAKSVLCVISSALSLGKDELRAGYEVIGNMKNMQRGLDLGRKPGAPDGPLGIIFAVKSDRSLEEIAGQIQELNSTRPSTEWPDMVVVLNKGTVNYAVQFPNEPIAGDFLLPGPAEGSYSPPPFYVHVFVRSAGPRSLNRMLSLIFTHLMASIPGTRFPDMPTTLKDVPQIGMTIAAYQFNLNWLLVPVPADSYESRGGLRMPPLRVTDRKGTLLSRLLFIPWQDGGVLKVFGRMPLDMFLLFLGPAGKKTQKYKRDDGELSSVLPVGLQGFRNMLQRFQKQSNMVILEEPRPKFIVAKMADEGTSSPYMARLFAGMLQLRDHAIPVSANRDPFDKAYDPVLNAIDNTRNAANSIVHTITQHVRRVSSGEAVKLQHDAIHVQEAIDKALRSEFDTFLMNAARAFKATQHVTAALGTDISFLYKKKNSFERRIAELRNIDPELADYLFQTRASWSEQLVLWRDELEHGGWVLPRFRYSQVGDAVVAHEPTLHSETLSMFVQRVLDRLCCFVEEIITHAVQGAMIEGVSLSEIPINERDQSFPQRFRLTLIGSGAPIWRLSYHESEFEQT